MKKIISFLVFLFLFSQIYTQNGHNGYSYSSSPMKIMGFSKDTTISQAITQVNKWGLKWDYNKFDKNTIEIKNVTWRDLTFESIWLTFNNYGRIKWIACNSPSGSMDKIQKTFSQIASGLPYRRMSIDTNMGTTSYIYNGYDESEFAIYSLSDNKYLPPIEFCFYFNGSIYENGFIP